MYTLLVTGAAAEQDHGDFRMPLGRFLEFTDDGLIAKLKPITASAVDHLRMWPCVLMEEGVADEKVRIGQLTDASQNSREVCLTFAPLWLKAPSPITNNDVWRLRDALDIGEFEFSRNHIAVKDRDLLSILDGAGYAIGPTARAHFKASGHLPPSTTIGPSAGPGDSIPPAVRDSRHPNRVFVVHGRNEAVRSSVVTYLRNLGLKPIVLHAQPSMGRHLLTKFIQEAELVTFAVVLMTDDDVGGVSASKLSPRARQNVILELGYFIARLGQDRVCALITPELETPSDFDGIVYIQMDTGDGWRQELKRELVAAKMPVSTDAIDDTA